MRRNVPTLKLVLRPILTVTSVCNTVETGDIYQCALFSAKYIIQDIFGRYGWPYGFFSLIFLDIFSLMVNFLGWRFLFFAPLDSALRTSSR